MAASGHSCPRCRQALGRAEVRGVGLEACTTCKGMLVAQVAVPKLLAAMSVDLLKNFDPDVEIKPITDAGGGLGCPSCARPMDNDSYCGAGIVFFDRCEPCGLLWLDSEELGAMTLMWTRMEGRRIRDRNEYHEELIALPSAYTFRDPSYLGASVADIIFGALLDR